MTSKTKNILYWFFTAWLALGLVSTGIFQISKNQMEIELFESIGFPAYVMVLLGAWKLLAVPAVLAPRYPTLKEWAYAGIFFNMTGALFAHLSVGSSVPEMFPPVLFLLIAAASYYFRPADRKSR